MEIVTTSNADLSGTVRAPTASPCPPPWSGGAPLPERLRRVLERLSGYDLSDVRVYPGSPWPARIGARAFVLGSDIHLSPGAEDALEHEAWHAVQQKQGRVHATRLAGFAPHPSEDMGLNEEEKLEREADTMGRVARSLVRRGEAVPVTGALRVATLQRPVVQRQVTVNSVEIDDVAVFQNEIKNRLYLVSSDVVDFANIIKDILKEKLVFKTWTDVRRELRVREVGYQVEAVMRQLAVVHGRKLITADKRIDEELKKADTAAAAQDKEDAKNYKGPKARSTKPKRDKSKAINKDLIATLSDRIYDEDGVIRWDNASYLKYKCKDQQMFQWLRGTRQNDPIRMNCWEAVLYALVKTGLVDKSYITWCAKKDGSGNSGMENLSKPSSLAVALLKNMDYFFWAPSVACGIRQPDKQRPSELEGLGKTIKLPSDMVIPKGRVLMFGPCAHVALSTGTLNGGRHGILELDASTGTVKEGTIEGLSNLYRVSMVVAPFPICPAGTALVEQEDEDKTRTREKIRVKYSQECTRKKGKVEELSQKKIAELEKQKEVPGNLQFEKEINELIRGEQAACRQECARLEEEADTKFEAEFNKWLNARAAPQLDVINLPYEASDPYNGELELL